MSELLHIGVVENVVGDISIFWFYRREGNCWIRIHTERCCKEARHFTLRKMIGKANLVPLGRA